MDSTHGERGRAPPILLQPWVVQSKKISTHPPALFCFLIVTKTLPIPSQVFPYYFLCFLAHLVRPHPLLEDAPRRPGVRGGKVTIPWTDAYGSSAVSRSSHGCPCVTEGGVLAALGGHPSISLWLGVS